MIDALGNLSDFELLSGQRNGICGMKALLEGGGRHCLRTKLLTQAGLPENLDSWGCKAVIPLCGSRKCFRHF